MESDVEETPKPVAVEPPRGTFQARVDDKGRLKLPSAFQKYLSDLGEDKVFITSLDTRTGRIYPIRVWKDNEKLFEDNSEHAADASDVAMIANHFGADSEIDGQGRVLVPTELRRHLRVENETVWLDCFRGRINLYSNAEYEQRRLRAMENLGEKLKTLERLGLK